jgi:hypothetical protein
MTGIAFKTNGSKTMIRTPVPKDGVHVQVSTFATASAGSTD